MFNQNKKEKDRPDLSSPTGLLNIIGVGTHIKGDLTSEGDIRVDGQIRGNVNAQARLVLGENGIVEGDITARDATIAGTVVGNINISGGLVLKPSSRIDGDIITDKLIIESGAQFNGACTMKSAVTDKTPSGNTLKSNAERENPRATEVR